MDDNGISEGSADCEVQYICRSMPVDTAKLGVEPDEMER